MLATLFTQLVRIALMTKTAILVRIMSLDLFPGTEGRLAFRVCPQPHISELSN